MKLKLIINGCESPDDYRLLRTTISTVASLRNRAILRFNSDRLVIISTPKSSLGAVGGTGSTNLSGTALQSDSGQLWCTIPRDVFSSYTVVSAREGNSITMEYSCDLLLGVFKRYDRAISRGSPSNMTFKLQAKPEWNKGNKRSITAMSGNTRMNAYGVADTHEQTRVKPNVVCILSVTFEEVVYGSYNDNNVTNLSPDNVNDDGNDYDYNVRGGTGSLPSIPFPGNSKVVLHSFKIPVRLLYKSQDMKIQEPMINYTQLMMYKLPPVSEEYGTAFRNFIRRIERYSNLNYIILRGTRNVQEPSQNEDSNEGNINATSYYGSSEGGTISLIVEEFHRRLEITWKGPIDHIIQGSRDGGDGDHTQDTSTTQGNNDSQSQARRHGRLLNHRRSSNYHEIGPLSATRNGNIASTNNEEEDLYQIEDSDINETRVVIDDGQVSGSGSAFRRHTQGERQKALGDISTMVERAERTSSSVHEVIIRSKDWRVCSKLYSAFEEVVLAISHDESCVFHCTLDRGSVDDAYETDKARERGQIIYYIVRARSLG